MRFEAFYFGSVRIDGLPVMDEVKHEAKRRHIKLLIVPTAEAIAEWQDRSDKINAILHVTC